MSDEKRLHMKASIQEIREDIHKDPDLTIPDMLTKAHRYMTLCGSMAAKSGQIELACHIFDEIMSLSQVMEDIEECDSYIKEFHLWAAIAAVEADFMMKKSKRGNRR